MTPELKARNMITRFTNQLFEGGYAISKPMIKECALVAITEILDADQDVYDDEVISKGGKFITFWNNVRIEIKKF